ncbi:hypothetical protein DBP71_26295, partial [Salmonella enterica subsp. enterica serovar 4,[5],12:i:-]
QDQLPSLIAQGIDRVVSGSALFRDDRLVENTRSWRAMFKVAGHKLIPRITGISPPITGTVC